MESKSLQKIGGVSAIIEAFIYITAFLVYGGLLTYPNAIANAEEKLNFLSDNYLILSILNLTNYVLFGILLAVLVQAIHQRLKYSWYYRWNSWYFNDISVRGFYGDFWN